MTRNGGFGLLPRPVAVGIIVLICAVWVGDLALAGLGPIMGFPWTANPTITQAFMLVAGLVAAMARGKDEPATPAPDQPPASPAPPVDDPANADADGAVITQPRRAGDAPGAVPYAELRARLLAEKNNPPGGDRDHP